MVTSDRAAGVRGSNFQDSGHRNDMSNHERFNVVYDGPALAEHRMDVRDLAPALVAIADLFTAANKELNGDSADVRVEVKGSFKAGSFELDLVFLQQLLTQIRDIFAGSSASAISNAYTILTVVGLIGSGGVIGLARKLRGRRPHRIEQVGEMAHVWITETESIEVEVNVVRLWRNSVVRSSLSKTLSPLEREGISNFGIVRGEQVELIIEDDELASFATFDNDSGEVVSDFIARKVLLVESVVFKDGNKWRVHDGQYPFFAALDDEEFLAKVNNGERFGKGDVLVVDLRQIQSIEIGALKNEYRIIKVHEHRAPLQQTLL
ncbi:hypothetical protein AWB79_07551 [Caballeronia hypogeia]|uniref:Uncharacterized protein n=1 Tax=Caballeronia hypogeia TaxID=1777140 RepID=A0A158DTV3_9BURK|nr:hypothetical protein [Caballeronia hypogeia]SAK98052.1 hypothetical protein AWB79_07551 [Caballeronia hypogeia]